MSELAPADRVATLLAAIEPVQRRLKVRGAVDRHFDDPHRNDGRGRRSAELKKLATTLRHIVDMQRWTDDERLQHQRTSTHPQDPEAHRPQQPWLRTVRECSAARGLVNKAGRTKNERKEHWQGRIEVLDSAHTSHPLNSITKLRSGGIRGDNCLRDNDYGYHDELRDGIAEIYEIRKNDVPVAWLRIERGQRRITDIHGPANEDVDLPPAVLRELCRRLDASGDDAELFIRNGVLSMFVHGSADPDLPMRVVRGYEFWWRRREIIVHDRRDDRWSRLLWRGGKWREAESSELNAAAFRAMCRLAPRIVGLAAAARPPARSRRSIRHPRRNANARA